MKMLNLNEKEQKEEYILYFLPFYEKYILFASQFKWSQAIIFIYRFGIIYFTRFIEYFLFHHFGSLVFLKTSVPFNP